MRRIVSFRTSIGNLAMGDDTFQLVTLRASRLAAPIHGRFLVTFPPSRLLARLRPTPSTFLVRKGRAKSCKFRRWARKGLLANVSP
jgi:hypothetical protein